MEHTDVPMEGNAAAFPDSRESSRIRSKYSKTVFEDTYNVFLDSIRSRGMVELDDLVKLIRMMQDFSMDCHIVVAGQNGVGKTFGMLMLMKKYLGPDWMKHLMLARHTTNDVIRFILTHENTVLGLDELNQYLSYTRHMEEEQKSLLQHFELARSKRIGVLGCVRDPRKVTLNYRQGKMSVCIWIIDRLTEGGSYAAVFVANPSVESFDRFGFGLLPGDLINISEVRESFEELPSFVGYLRIPDIKGHLTGEEIERYKTEKNKALAYAHVNALLHKYRRMKINTDELREELESLAPVLGIDEVQALIKKIPKRYKTKKAEDDSDGQND